MAEKLGIRELYSKHETLLNEYEEILLGTRKVFSDDFFGLKKPFSENNALAVIQYAFERYLKWPPNVIARRLDRDMMERLHLMTVVKYVKFPPEYSKERDFFYLVALVYPNYRVSLRKRIVHVYTSLLAGKIMKFPKDYMVGDDGYVRACICLQYLMTEILCTEIGSSNDAYAMFATPYGLNILKKYKLMTPCDELFETPVDFVHMALPDDEQDEFLHDYYKFLYMTTVCDEDGNRKKKSYPKKDLRDMFLQAKIKIR